MLESLFASKTQHATTARADIRKIRLKPPMDLTEPQGNLKNHSATTLILMLPATADLVGSYIASAAIGGKVNSPCVTALSA